MIIKHDLFSPDTRLLLLTGVVGGFTAFSGFGVDTFYLLKRRELKRAAMNAGLSPLTGILAIRVGAKLVS